MGEIVRTFAIMILLGNNGAVNLALKSLGLIDRPIPFMYTGFSVSFGVIYLTSLYMLLPLYSALEKIPKSYSEAAADLGALIFGNGLWFEFMFSNGSRTRTKRISWDGMRNVTLDGRELHGDAYDPMQDIWIAFEVDMLEGTAKGGSYNI